MKYKKMFFISIYEVNPVTLHQKEILDFECKTLDEAKKISDKKMNLIFLDIKKIQILYTCIWLKQGDRFKVVSEKYLSRCKKENEMYDLYGRWTNKIN